MKKVLFICLVFMIIVMPATAAWQKWWKGLGADDNWNTNWNWNQVGTDKGAAPLPTDNAYYDSALVSGSQTDMVIDGAFGVNNFKNEDGDMYIVSGGSLMVNGSYIDIGGYDGSTTGKSASLTMTGNAALTTGDNCDIHIGNYIDGTLTLQDDAFINSWNLKIGLEPGVTGHVQLDGGTIETNYLLMRKNVGSVGTMDINGDGKIIIHRTYDTEAELDDWKFVISQYISNNWIYTTTAGNTILPDHEFVWQMDPDAGYERWMGTTTISSIPEPATVFVLGLGGLIVSRRKNTA